MDPGELLDLLKRRTGFTEAHAALLRELGKVMVPIAHEVALAFYDYLGRDPELGAILHAEPGRVERLYRTFARWYGELFSGVYDRAYAERRRRIGLVAQLGHGEPTEDLVPESPVGGVDPAVPRVLGRLLLVEGPGLLLRLAQDLRGPLP